MNNTKANLQNLLFLNSIRGIGPKTLLEVLNKFETAENILNLDYEELINTGIRQSIAVEILKKDFSEANRQLDLAEKNNINLIALNDSNYPWQLRNIYDPPIILYINGNESILNDLQIAIVGARDCTHSGIKAADYFAYNLAKSNIVVSSGLARGIDFYAHNACLKAQGQTIGVMGTSIDQIYPKNHNYLVSQILDSDGCIISELPFSTPPKAQNFPRRNRIISGLSKGVIVVEAKERSGSLVTARMALEQGREVFAIPGSIFNKESLGTNKLLQNGAKLVLAIEDVLEELELQNKNIIEKKNINTSFNIGHQEINKNNKINKLDNILKNLNENEKQVFDLINLENNKIMSYDFIVANIKINPNKLSVVLMNLELEGLITKLPGGYSKAS